MRVANSLIFVAAAAVVSSVLAADSTWNGTSSSAWSTPGNWTNGVPGTTDQATIPYLTSGYYPATGSGPTLGGLVMDFGSQFTVTGGTLTLNKATGKTNTLDGTISLSGSGTQMQLTVGVRDWTNLGVMEFSSGAGFVPADVAFGIASDRVLYNSDVSHSGTIRALTADTRIYLPFTQVVGGTVDGSWRPQSTLVTYYGGALTFDTVTLGSTFQAVSNNSSEAANFTLLNSVTNNSSVFTYPAYGTMALAVISGSTFTFSGSGGLGLQGQTLGGTGVNTIANQGTHTLRGYGTIGAVNLTNAGTVQATGGTAGALQSLNVGTLNNQGTVVVDQYNTLHVSGDVTSGASSLFHVNGTLEAPSVSVAGWLTGGGTIITSSGVTLLNGSTVSSGNSAGTLTVAGDLRMDGGAHWDIDAGDEVDVTGTLTFLPGAAIALDIAPGTLGGPYTFLKAQSVAGVPDFTFAGIQGVVIRDGNTFSLQVPEPAIMSMLGASSLLTLRRRRNR